jgi:acyl carrier protein
MSAHNPLLHEIRTLVEGIAGPSRTPTLAGPETRLSDGYWLDSVELLEVLIACETKFGVVFDERRDFEDGSLDTLGTLTSLVRSKLPAAESNL